MYSWHLFLNIILFVSSKSDNFEKLKKSLENTLHQEPGHEGVNTLLNPNVASSFEMQNKPEMLILDFTERRKC